MRWQCDKCGTTIEADHIVLPVYCCTPPPTSSPVDVPRPCVHRGDYLGQASCGCGAVYRCDRLLSATGQPMLCGNRIPIDEFVDFQGTTLNPDTYRRCPDCPDHAAAPPKA